MLNAVNSASSSTSAAGHALCGETGQSPTPTCSLTSAAPAGCLSRPAADGQGAAFTSLVRQASAPTPAPAQQRSVLDPVADRMLCLDGQAARLAVTTTRPMPVDAPPPAASGLSEERTETPAVALAEPSPPPPMPAGTGAAREMAPSRQDRDDLAGLGMGDGGPEVARVQRVLKKWNRHLDLEVSGTYDEPTRRAVHLYKAIYGTGHDGRSLDARTSDCLARMEDGTFWNAPPEKSLAGRILYAASQDLGKPYRMGGDGVTSTDCAMLTRRALVRAGVADADLTRLADQQLRDAEQGSNGLQRVTSPKPGDLVFFDNRTSQSSVAYKGVTHVGIWLGGGLMLAASSGQGKVVIQEVGSQVAGFARAQEAVASR